MRALLAIFCLLTAFSAHAEENLPLYYSRTQILVLPRATAETQKPGAMPWAAPSADPGLLFEVELRDGMTLYNQEGWFDVSGLSEKNGLMLAFAAPVVAPIVRATQYAPLDVLMIDKEGMILQIFPGLMLSELQKDLYPEQPVLAILYLAGGTCEKNHIAPGDRIAHPLFRKPPKVLTVPPAEKKGNTP